MNRNVHDPHISIAEMIGTTRSRVSQFINKFRNLGFISYNGTLEIHNSLLSVVLHDNPHLKNKAEGPAHEDQFERPSKSAR